MAKVKKPARKSTPAKAKAKTSVKTKTAKKSPAKLKVIAGAKSKPAAKKKTAAKVKPKAKAAKVVRLPVKKAAKAKVESKTATPPRSHLKLVVDNKKSKEWAQVLTPLDDRVLVLIDESRERVTPGGLIIPDTAEVEGNHRGKVVSVGPGHRDAKGRFRPIELKVGDVVLFGQYSGTEIKLENQNFKILRETDVLGLVTK